MFAQILVGIDPTDAADDALALAQRLRDSASGRLVLAIVIDALPDVRDPLAATRPAHELIEPAQRRLYAVSEGLPSDVPCTTRILSGASPARALYGEAEALGADLIVLGSTRRRRVGRWLERATVQRLMRGAPCAVAVAAPGQAVRDVPWSTLRVAFDGSPESDVALEAAFAIASGPGGEVVLHTALERLPVPVGFTGVAVAPVAVEDLEAASRRAAETAARRAPPRVETRVQVTVDGDPAAQLLGEAEPTALLVAGSRSYGPLRRVLAGSVSARLAVNGDVPILITPRALVPSGGDAPPGADAPA